MTNVKILFMTLCILGSIYNLSSQCPDYEVRLEWAPNPPVDNCGHKYLDVSIVSTSTLNFNDINFSIGFGGSSIIHIDDTDMSNIYSSWLDLTVGISGVSGKGKATPTIPLNEVTRMFTIKFSGLEPGAENLTIGNFKIDFNGQPACPNTSQYIEDINHPDEEIYDGYMRREPGGCSVNTLCTMPLKNCFEDVDVIVHEIDHQGMSDPQLTTTSLNSGYYSLQAVNPGFSLLEDQCYIVCPTFDLDPSCGIYWDDIAEIRTWILGSSCTPTKWALIAADTWRDGFITTKDLAVLSKIINGTFDYNETYWDPWKIIQKDQYNSLGFNMCDLTVPDYDICYEISSTSTQNDIDWVLIKTGDVWKVEQGVGFLFPSCERCKNTFTGGSTTRSNNKREMLDIIAKTTYSSNDNVVIRIDINQLNEMNMFFESFEIADGYELENVRLITESGRPSNSIFDVNHMEEESVLRLAWVSMFDDIDEQIEIELSRLDGSYAEFPLSKSTKYANKSVAVVGKSNYESRYSFNYPENDVEEYGIVQNGKSFLLKCNETNISLMDVEVYTIQGRLVYNQNVTCGEWNDVNIENGIYIINIPKLGLTNKFYKW